MSDSTAAYRIDLNADLGEGSPEDAEVIRWVSSANIACGGHAGDAESMAAAVARCAAQGVRLGAHPGYPDRAGFGRRELGLTPAEIGVAVRAQVTSLKAIADDAGVPLIHVKPHGALYHRAAQDAEVAAVLIEVIRDLDPQLALVGLAGSPLLDAARAAGLRVLAEAFADRGYRADGGLQPRGLVGALIEAPDAVAAQALELVREGAVRAVDGQRVAVRADTLCLHGDGAGAAARAAALHRALMAAGVQIAAVQP
jgi:UPF0271 protein